METIVDMNGNKRNISYLKIIRKHDKDVFGKSVIISDFVEVEVVGKKRNWIEYYPLLEFKKLNPGVIPSI